MTEALRRAGLVLVLSFLIGLVAASTAIGFANTVVILNDFFLISDYARFRSTVDPLTLTLLSLCIPMAGGMIVAVLIFKLDPRGRPAGPADVIKAIQLQAAMPQFRSGMASSLAAMLSLGVGASVGQYGPSSSTAKSLSHCYYSDGLPENVLQEAI